jgi:hypothetical protein
MPLFYASTNRILRQAAPKERLERLQIWHKQNSIQNLKMTSELLRLLRILDEQGIQAIPFKGPALAQQLYGDILIRMFSDLDLFIHERDVLEAKEILLKEGYIPEIQISPIQEKAYLDSESEYIFIHKSNGTRIDLHWRLISPCYSIGFDHKELWSRIRTSTLEGQIILSLPPEELLIALSIHGVRHYAIGGGLKQICDISRLIEQNKGIDWNIITWYTNRFRIERILLLNLKLAMDIQGIDLPPEILKKIDADQNVKYIALKVSKNFFEPMPTYSSLRDQLFFWFYAREYILDGFRGIMLISFKPNATTRSFLALPDLLRPLYYLIHPIRLILQHKI